MDAGTGVAVVGLGVKILDSVTKAIGTLYEPHRIRNEAKARAEAKGIEAESDAQSILLKAQTDAEAKALVRKSDAEITVEILELENRAVQRLMTKERRRQRNIEGIVSKSLKAAEQMEDDSDSEKPDEDWVHRFFDHCQDIGDEEMQTLWAKLLAGEVSRPGTYTLQTLAVVRIMQKYDADMFRAFCSYVWITDQFSFYPVVGMRSGYTPGGHETVPDNLDMEKLAHLDSLGLIKKVADSSYVLRGGESVLMSYFDHQYRIAFRSEHQTLPLGTYMLTSPGRQLFFLAEPESLSDYRDQVVEAWRSHHQLQVEYVGVPDWFGTSDEE